MRRVWIEMFAVRRWMLPKHRSPSMRRVWIEMTAKGYGVDTTEVTLHAEGVD